MSRVRLQDIMGLSVNVFVADDREFVEHSLKLKCAPEIAIQLLAFNGMAHNEQGELVHISDWESISPHVLDQIRRTLAIGYRRVVTKQIEPESDGSFAFSSGQVTSTVQNGGLEIPDPKELEEEPNIAAAQFFFEAVPD